MIIFPAIDLKAGRVVRLQQGRADAETVYFNDPAIPAARFRDAGLKWVHVVDLDGAFTGTQANRDAVRTILASGLKVQLGGGIRNLDTVKYWLDLGVSRLVIGTMAATHPEFLRECLRHYPAEAFAVGIDARNGKVSIKGWVQDLPMSATELAIKVQDLGIQTIIYTDISRDGMLSGPNFDAQVALLESLSVKVIASGGVASNHNIQFFRSIAETHPNLLGVIVGKAIYDGTVDLT